MAKKQTKPETTESQPSGPATEAPPALGIEKEKKKPPKQRVVKASAGAEVTKSAPMQPPAPPLEAPPTKAPTEPPPAEPTKKKGKRPGVPPPLGKKRRNQWNTLRQKIAKQGPVPVSQAVSLLKQNKQAKFDETVEVHMSLGIDPKQSDQMVRGSIALPHGIGKAVRLLVFAQGDNAAKAKEAGADYVGGEELAKKIQGEGWLDFDVALATPDMMGVVGRLGKILGPRGLMPTPKAGTVLTGDVAAGVREFKAGKVEYRADAGGNVHAPVGKLSFDEDKLLGNITTFIEQIRHVKPSAAKGNYIKSITITATMSPGIPVSA